MARNISGRQTASTSLPSHGYYNLERMIRRVLSAKGRVLMCGTCMDARGLTEGEMLEGATRSTMDELVQATLAADKVLVF